MPAFGTSRVEEIGKGAARLERSRVLEQLKLERECRCGQAKLVAIDLDDGRAPDMRPDDPFASRDGLRISVLSGISIAGLYGGSD